MQQTMAWAIVPARNERLARLLELYRCADVVAPVDVIAYGRRAGELIGRAVGRPKRLFTEEPTQHATFAETAGGSLLEVPRSDRLTLLLAASASLLLLAASASLLMTGSAPLY
jgi:hypothetical protein